MDSRINCCGWRRGLKAVSLARNLALNSDAAPSAIGAAHDKTYNKTCVTSKDSDQSVYPPSTAMVIFLWIAQKLLKAQAISEDSDQTARMCRLI